jgi:YHS domain-containing protein
LKIPLFNRHPDTEVDPVCHMDVPIKNPSGGTDDHEGQTFFFCAPGCRAAFSKEPEKYLDPEWKGFDM